MPCGAPNGHEGGFQVIQRTKRGPQLLVKGTRGPQKFPKDPKGPLREGGKRPQEDPDV